MVLSLDIDGVLNSHKTYESGYCGIDAENAQWLNLILKECPKVKLLIHSSWRYMMLTVEMTVRGFEYLLITHGIHCHGRLLGCTEADAPYEHSKDTFEADLAERVDQIRGWWLGQEQNGGMIVSVDDLPLNIYHFVKTDGKVGLIEEHARTIIRLFRGEAQ